MTAKIKLNAASGGGSFSLQAPSSSSNNRVFTLPDSADATLLTSTSSVGKILQVVQTRVVTVSSTSSTSFSDTSLVRTITPSSASNKILCLVDMQFGGGHGVEVIFKLVRFDNTGTGTNIAYSGVSTNMPGFFGTYTIMTGGLGYYGLINAGVNTLDTAVNAAEHSYRVQWRATGGTGYLNRTGYGTTANNYSETGCSTITLMEVAA